MEFLYEVTPEKFQELSVSKMVDNKDVMFLLQSFVDNDDDRRFNFTILNLGTLMKICALELEFKQNEIEKYLSLQKTHTRDRKMGFILKELNKKINLRYDFDEKTEIVPCLYTYKGKGYIYVDKYTFVKLLGDVDIDIETLENV